MSPIAFITGNRDKFGWDALFCPDGSTQTFAQMTSAEKNRYSMRRIAIEGLQRYIRHELK